MNNQPHLPLWRIVLPGLLGNVLEWYDFALYGYFAVIISPLFFPAQNETLSLIAAFSVFAVGYFMRPLGAMLFGSIGDRLGRKYALSLAILLMAIPTTVIGLLPSYQQIGYLSTGILLICRLLQGLAVGGEFTGSMVFILEHAGHHHKNFYSALTIASAFVGLLLGSLAASIVQSFPIEWLWRIPFVISILLGVIGIYLRLRMPETPAFTEMKRTKTGLKSPVKTLFSQHLSAVFIGTGIVMLPTASFYMCFLYLPTYLSFFLDFSSSQVQWLNNIGIIALIICTSVFGLVADHIGRFRLQVAALFSFIVFSLPLFWLIASPNQWVTLFCILCFSVLTGSVFAVIPALIFDLFPAAVRVSGLSFPYNLATALFGGTTPAINTALINASNNLLIPAFYLMILATGSLINMYILLKHQSITERSLMME